MHGHPGLPHARREVRQRGADAQVQAACPVLLAVQVVLQLLLGVGLRPADVAAHQLEGRRCTANEPPSMPEPGICAPCDTVGTNANLVPWRVVLPGNDVDEH